MNFKVSLPNPDNGTPEEFFTQIRIVIKACEKSYQEMTKDLTQEEKEKSFYLAFRYPTLEDKMDKIDSDMNERQNIELELNQA